MNHAQTERPLTLGPPLKNGELPLSKEYTAATSPCFEPCDSNSYSATLHQASFPQFIKYMGSKAKILDFVIAGINEVYDGGGICDLFAGSASLAGAIGDQVPFISNDIQRYSAVLAGAYLMQDEIPSTISAGCLIEEARPLAEDLLRSIGPYANYDSISEREAFVKAENDALSLYSKPLPQEYHLFTRFYSGTWWSAEQCAWIDALRAVADRHEGHAHHLILATLMHAMAYCGQGTGHFAQYRDATTDHAFKNISLYRKRSLPEYFARKWHKDALPLTRRRPVQGHQLLSEDYVACLEKLKPCTVYADPPYCFVHYSRFYHALETLVRYDYPEIQHKNGKPVKGRYRSVRHQSPFSIGTQVPGAFTKLFQGVQASGSNLVLSYSNTGMITLEELLSLAQRTLGRSHELQVLTMAHVHMTMGRAKDRDRDVTEALLLAQKK